MLLFLLFLPAVVFGRLFGRILDNGSSDGSCPFEVLDANEPAPDYALDILNAQFWARHKFGNWENLLDWPLNYSEFCPKVADITGVQVAAFPGDVSFLGADVCTCDGDQCECPKQSYAIRRSMDENRENIFIPFINAFDHPISRPNPWLEDIVPEFRSGNVPVVGHLIINGDPIIPPGSFLHDYLEFAPDILEESFKKIGITDLDLPNDRFQSWVWGADVVISTDCCTIMDFEAGIPLWGLRFGAVYYTNCSDEQVNDHKKDYCPHGMID